MNEYSENQNLFNFGDVSIVFMAILCILFSSFIITSAHKLIKNDYLGSEVLGDSTSIESQNEVSETNPEFLKYEDNVSGLKFEYPNELGNTIEKDLEDCFIEDIQLNTFEVGFSNSNITFLVNPCGFAFDNTNANETYDLLTRNGKTVSFIKVRDESNYKIIGSLKDRVELYIIASGSDSVQMDQTEIIIKEILIKLEI